MVSRGVLIVLVCAFSIRLGLTKKLEVLQDKQLLELIKTEKYVVVLFGKLSILFNYSSTILASR